MPSREVDDNVSAADLARLGEFLSLDAVAKTSMTVSMVDGFLTACVIGPELILPSNFIPWIWDVEKGEAQPEFESREAAEDLFEILVAMQNRIAAGLAKEPAAFTPLFALHDSLSPQEWVQGLEVGASFEPEQWDGAMEEESEIFAPLLALDHADARTASKDNWPHLLTELEFAVIGLRDYFRLPMEDEPAGVTYVRPGPKIGRNEPCPCGSGRKYKHCCGLTH